MEGGREGGEGGGEEGEGGSRHSDHHHWSWNDIIVNKTCQECMCALDVYKWSDEIHYIYIVIITGRKACIRDRTDPEFSPFQHRFSPSAHRFSPSWDHFNTGSKWSHDGLKRCANGL